jgi:L-lactate dehydrogenase (cytochrome)
VVTRRDDLTMFESLRSVVRLRSIELDPVARRLSRCACVEDMRAMARRRLPSGVFDYVDGGAEGEASLANNVAAFGRIGLRPRVLRDVGEVDTTATVLGRAVPFPLVLAPTGFTRMVDPAGELAVARAAAAARLPYTLSTLSTRSIEEVAGASDGRKWFQVYVWRDRGLVKEMLERARVAGYEAIVVTVDTAVLGRRERDVRRGFTLPPKIGLDTVIDGVRHPAWAWQLIRNEPIVFANVAAAASTSPDSTAPADGSDPVTLSDYINSQFDPALSWADIAWFRDVWAGPILLKGIQGVDDACLAADAGVDAVILSNHGGRQLDGAPAPIDLVAPVSDALAGRVEVICDGGIRRGSDIFKALALGADACMIGRAYLYGLAAGGEAGVSRVLDDLASGLRRTMTLCGTTRVNEIERAFVTSGL